MNTTNMKVLAVALLAACLLCLIPVSLGTNKVIVDGKVLSSSSIPALSAIAGVRWRPSRLHASRHGEGRQT